MAEMVMTKVNAERLFERRGLHMQAYCYVVAWDEVFVKIGGKYFRMPRDFHSMKAADTEVGLIADHFAKASACG